VYVPGSGSAAEAGFGDDEGLVEGLVEAEAEELDDTVDVDDAPVPG
jgi:hypothetical protein